jgi:hypothetical protein
MAGRNFLYEQWKGDYKVQAESLMGGGQWGGGIFFNNFIDNMLHYKVILHVYVLLIIETAML